MRHQDDGKLFGPADVLERRRKPVGGGAVEGAGRLVQQQDLGPADQDPGEAHPLLLAPGEGPGVPGKQLRGEAAQLQGADDLLAVGRGKRRVAVEEGTLQVVEDRALEHEGLLLHHPDPAAQLERVDLRQLLTGEENAPFGGVLQPVDQPDQGAFPAARGADDDGGLPPARSKEIPERTFASFPSALRRTFPTFSKRTIPALPGVFPKDTTRLAKNRK